VAEVAEAPIDAGEELALLARGGARRERLLAVVLHRARGVRARLPLEVRHVLAALRQDAGALVAGDLGLRVDRRGARRVFVYALGTGADEPVADPRALRVDVAARELALVVGPAGEARADVVDERVALLHLRVELCGVALQDAEAAAARGEVVRGGELVVG